MKRQGMTIAALAALLLVMNASSPANAVKFYKDTETGQVYASPGDGREEYKPFGIDLGFQVFLDYRHELARPNTTPRSNQGALTRPYSAFECQRSIIDIKKSFTQNTRARLVLDNRGPANGYAIYVRHVYGEVDLPSYASTFSFGEIPNVLVPYDDGFWGWRVQGSSFLEREGLFAASGDWGLGLAVKPKSIPLEWVSTLTNGQGRTTQELNGGKAVETRLTWNVSQLPGLQLNGGYYRSLGGNGGTAVSANGADSVSTRYVASVYFKRPNWRVGAEYVWARDKAGSYGAARSLVPNGNTYPNINMNQASVPANGYGNSGIGGHGYSILGSCDIPGTKFSLLGRCDYYRPCAVDQTHHYRYIAGPAFTLSDNVRFLVNWEALKFGNTAKRNSANVYDNDRILVQSEIKF